jgi:F0F1-type ATP synthase assembly protein I
MKRKKPFEKEPYQKEVFQAFTLITQLGISMLIPIFAMTLVGIALDRKFGTSFWTILLFFVGAIAGGNGVFRIMKKFLGRMEHPLKRLSEEWDDHRDSKKDE